MALALTVQLSGQSTIEYRQRLQRVLQANADLDSAVSVLSARRRRFPLDTVRIGPVHVIAQRPHAARAAELTRTALATIQATYGEQSEALRQHFFVLNFGTDDWNTWGSSAVWMADTGAPDRLVDEMARVIYEKTDSTFQNWLGGTVPIRGTDDQDARDALVYEELVTSPWHLVQGCHAGDLAACRLALGLDGRVEPWLSWYDATDRRFLVERTYLNSPRRAECITNREDSACLTTIRLEQRGNLAPPFSNRARQSLLAIALHDAGASAFERVSLATGDLVQRLGAAAGLPPDSLISRWRERILAARPQSVALVPQSAWGAVCWCLILVGLGLRSTRWR